MSFKPGKTMKKKKILLVDDDKPFAEAIKDNLLSTGKYLVRTEYLGSNTTQAAGEFKPNLILLDIIMPDMGGESVVLELKNCEATKNIPIVFLTAILSEKEAKKQGEVLCGYHVLAKPFTIDQLLNTVQKNIA